MSLREKLDKLGEMGGFDRVGDDPATGRTRYRFVYCDPAEVARRERAGEPLSYILTATGSVVWSCSCPAWQNSRRWDDCPSCKHARHFSDQMAPAPKTGPDGPKPAVVTQTPAQRRRQYRSGWDAYLAPAA